MGTLIEKEGRYFKECKVIMLPTEYKTNLIFNESLKILGDHTYFSKVAVELNSYINYQHLYITSDDEIKEGDWYVHCSHGSLKYYVEQAKNNNWKYKSTDRFYLIGKIIATTDKDLTFWNDEEVDGFSGDMILYQPSKAFIEKYCKVGGINEVMVEYDSCVIATKDDWDRHTKYYPKTNSHNEITIHPIKDSWNREEVEELCSKAWLEGFKIGLQHHTKPSSLNELDWIKQNL